MDIIRTGLISLRVNLMCLNCCRKIATPVFIAVFQKVFVILVNIYIIRRHYFKAGEDGLLNLDKDINAEC